MVDASTASADQAPVRLEWHVPDGEGCPTDQEVLAQVSRLVDVSRATQWARVSARADVQKLEKGRFRVELTTLVAGQRGQRSLEERSCAAMAEATVLILAWMVDPNLAEAQPSQREPLHPTATRSATARDRSQSPPMRSQSDRGHMLALGVHLLVDAGTLPSAAIGAGVGASASFGSFRAVAHAGAWPHQTAQLYGAGGPGASFSLAAGGLGGCMVPLRLDLAVCTGLELDQLRGRGRGVDLSRAVHDWWLAFDLSADGRVRLGSGFALTAAARLVLPTHRDYFGLDNLGIVHRPAAVAGRFAAGLEFQL